MVGGVSIFSKVILTLWMYLPSLPDHCLLALQRHSMLKQQDLNVAMMVTSREVLSALSQLVPCVGCRRSVERLFSQLVESGNPALEPLTVGAKGVLSVTRSCMMDAKKLYTLFYVHG